MSVIPWSFSSWEKYNNVCPRQYYETKIACNFVEEPSEATIWGSEVHLALEQRALTGAELPERMKRFQPVADRLIYAPGETYPELKLAIDAGLQPVEFDSEDAYARGIGDLIKINDTKALAADWKTGKRKPQSLQLDLMGVLVLAKFPIVQQVTTCFMWFQEPTRPTSKIIYREQMVQIIDQFDQGVKNMLWSEQNNVWPEKPSGLCKGWCPVKTCRHWRPKWKK